jgi:transcriptional regulator with AAA-type ATPase domain
VRPVGGDSEKHVDVRVIAASRDDLDAEVAAGRFRIDRKHLRTLARKHGLVAGPDNSGGPGDDE